MQRDISLRQDLRNARPPTDRQQRRQTPPTQLQPQPQPQSQLRIQIHPWLAAWLAVEVVCWFQCCTVDAFCLTFVKRCPRLGAGFICRPVCPCTPTASADASIVPQSHSLSPSLAVSFSQPPQPTGQSQALAVFSVISPIINQTIYIYIVYRK